MDNTSMHNPQKENFDLLDSIIGFFRWIKRGLKSFFLSSRTTATGRTPQGVRGLK